MARLLSALLLFLVAFSAATQSVSTDAFAANQEGRRVAFVVGNSQYKNVPVLANPDNDARAVAAALTRAGFEVVSAFDLDRKAFDGEFHKFIRTLSGADVSLFYYSGHGIQIGGDNRLIPVDAALQTDMDLEVETIGVKTILGYMQSNSRVQAVFLDSCRNNPFPARSFLIGPDRESTPQTGLAAQDAASGSLIAYSTQPGNVAVDGSGEFSPFTEAFLRHAFTLGLDLQSALMKVTQDVWTSTNQRQRPWTSYTLVEPLYLAKPSVVIAAANDAAAGTKTGKTVVIEPAPAEPAAIAGSDLAKNVAELMDEAFAKPRPVPIGVGPVAMLGDFPLFRGEPNVQVELAQTPSSGVLYLDGSALLAGSVLKPGNLRQVTYEPALGSEGSPVGLEWKVRQAADASGLPVEGKLAPFIVDCDREAGEPLDLQGVGPGKLPNEVDAAAAMAACSRAVEEFPNVARYKYQLGRAKLAAKEVAEALQLFDKAAGEGHTRALYQLGYMAQRGLGRAQDLVEAERLFARGAELGDPYAMLAHGRNLVFGRGVAADPDAGVKFLNRAVELGHTYAMNELGNMYYHGRAVKKNAERGVRFYEAALARNDIYAMNNMGLAYLDGEGVKKDTATALALFTRASEGGHPEAPGNIGRMYFNGSGIKKDLKQAVHWYEIGAERGDTWAASNLGWIFQNGPDRTRNIAKAALYYGFAVALDAYGRNPDAAAALKRLPEKAKAEAVKHLVAEIGNDGLETASDLDGTLVLLERKAWQRRNPRLDLF
jgi:TPR repeat protein